jgi:MYXO-CTERM domain-containing protein
LVDPTAYLSSTGPLDPNYTGGTLHNLRIAAAFISNTIKGPNDASTPVPIANVVVPTGTPFQVIGAVGGNLGQPQGFAIGSGPVIGVNEVYNPGNLIADVTMQGNHGSYLTQTFPVTGPAQIAGFLSLTGLTPADDEQTFGLDVSNGSSETLAQIANDLQTSLLPLGGMVELVSSLPAPIQTEYPSGDNLSVYFPLGSDDPANYFSNFYYNLSSYGGAVSVTSVTTIVPEPTGLGALALAAIALHRRRKSRRA